MSAPGTVAFFSRLDQTIMRIVFGFVCLALLTGAWFGKDEQWTLFFFPDRTQIPNATQVGRYVSGSFESFETCQSSGVAQVWESSGQAAYQCGLNCSSDTGLLICETTRR